MNVTVNQQITIHQLRIGQVAHSSVLQIGAAGMVKPVSYQFHAVGYNVQAEHVASAPPIVPLVPLPVIRSSVS